MHYACTKPAIISGKHSAHMERF